MGAWQEIVDYTVPSNTTSVVLDSFGTITKDDFVKVVATFVNTGGNTNDIFLSANTATSSSSYHRQRIIANGSSITALRANDNRIAEVANGQTSSTFTYIKLAENDRINFFSLDNRRNDSLLEQIWLYTTSSGATFTSGVSTLTFTSSLTNGIGTGTRIQIYKLAAEKVADITVGTNSTQVDIPLTGVLDPAIDKDSEYLLVSEGINATNANSFLQLFVNDNTTATDYRTQRIAGLNSTASALRFNDASFQNFVRNDFSPTPVHNIAYTHIKLSNIGAYTFQSYVQILGGSAIGVQNYFGSSTAENITSITKLNIVAQVSNAIASGARFILYKLY